MIRSLTVDYKLGVFELFKEVEFMPFGYGPGWGGFGYGGFGYGGFGHGGFFGRSFVLIVVLFILLIIVGAAWC
jgi:uncharacterized protein (TIGR01732 family)